MLGPLFFNLPAKALSLIVAGLLAMPCWANGLRCHEVFLPKSDFSFTSWQGELDKLPEESRLLGFDEAFKHLLEYPELWRKNFTLFEDLFYEAQSLAQDAMVQEYYLIQKLRADIMMLQRGLADKPAEKIAAEAVEFLINDGPSPSGGYWGWGLWPYFETGTNRPQEFLDLYYSAAPQIISFLKDWREQIRANARFLAGLQPHYIYRDRILAKAQYINPMPNWLQQWLEMWNQLENALDLSDAQRLQLRQEGYERPRHLMQP